MLLVGLLAGALAVTAALLPRIRAGKAALTLLEADLTAAREERRALEAELQAAQDAADASRAVIDAENAELRRRMDELADLIMRREGAPAAPSSEGP